MSTKLTPFQQLKLKYNQGSSNPLNTSDMQARYESGEEYLYPGRRNYFSPITSYKVMKSKYYTEDGKSFDDRDVPLEKWEIDMVCDQTTFDADRLWKSVKKESKRPDRPQRRRTYEDIVKSDVRKNNWSVRDDVIEQETIADHDGMYCQPIGGMLNIEPDIETPTYEEVIQSALHIVDNVDGCDFQTAKLLEEAVKLDAIQETQQLGLKTTINKEKFDSVQKTITLIEGVKNIGIKDEIKRNINFIKRSTRYHGCYKEFNYSTDEKYQQVDWENIFQQLMILMDLVKDTDPKYINKVLDKIEKEMFFFLRIHYHVNFRQKVILIPSGGGKTTLFKKFPHLFVDIDYMLYLFDDYEFFSFCQLYCEVFNRWSVLNRLWQFIVFRYQHLMEGKILLCHSKHQLPFNAHGYNLRAIIPLKKVNYDVRYFKSNSASIKEEVASYITINQDQMFLIIYRLYFQNFKDSDFLYFNKLYT